MAKKYAYIRKNNAVSTNRFDYPYAADDEFGEVDPKTGINSSPKSVSLSKAYPSGTISAIDSGKGSRTSELVKP